jgi:Mg2+ and Co2+ transporter CorA
MAIQQEIIAKQTAEETAIQLELAKQSTEQSAIQLELARQSTEQNKSFLVFTIITTIFLPLSFFTSVRPPPPTPH